jgi:hypothetical protein
VSDRHEDDEELEPVSIEVDAPEADWIEQHQPVMDPPEDDLFPSEIPEDVAEADALDQARTVPDDDFGVDGNPSIAASTEFAEDASGDEPDQLEVTGDRAGVRGCNLIGVVADALMRGAGRSRQISPRSAGPPR